MTQAPTLTDGTVTIRAHREADARGLLRAVPGPVSQQWTTVPIPYAMDDARTFVGEIMPKGWADDSEWGFAVEAEGRYAGTISLRNEGDGRAEIAYGSHPWVRGTGVMERALRLLLEWGFTEQRPARPSSGGPTWATGPRASSPGGSASPSRARCAGWLPQRGELRDAWVGTLLRDDPREPRTPWLTSPVLEADGLRLRPWRDADVPRIVEACPDASTQRWLGQLPAPYDDAAGATSWRPAEAAGRDGEAMNWAVVDPADDLLLASVGFRLDARGRVRDRLLDPPGGPRARGDDPGAPAGDRATPSRSWASSGSWRSPPSTTRPHAG